MKNVLKLLFMGSLLSMSLLLSLKIMASDDRSAASSSASSVNSKQSAFASTFQKRLDDSKYSDAEEALVMEIKGIILFHQLRGDKSFSINLEGLKKANGLHTRGYVDATGDEQFESVFIPRLTVKMKRDPELKGFEISFVDAHFTGSGDDYEYELASISITLP